MLVSYKQFFSFALVRVFLPCSAGAILLALSACANGPKPVELPSGNLRVAINEPITTIPSIEPLNLMADHPDVELGVSGQDNVVHIKLTPTILAIVEPEQLWQLKQGETIRSELSKWAKDSGWSLVWQFDKDWVIPSNSEFTGSFDIASAKVVETLASNGILIHANFFSANKTLVITGPGVTPQ